MFSNKFNQLKKHIQDKKSNVKNEAQTGHFCRAYDTAELENIQKQYTADHGRKGNENRVDYALLKDGKVFAVVEVKHHKENLREHLGQVAGYFAATEAEFAQDNLYIHKIKDNIVKEMIKEPSEDCIKFFKTVSGKQNLRAKRKEKFKELIKEAFEAVVEECSKMPNSHKENSNQDDLAQYNISQEKLQAFEKFKVIIKAENLIYEKMKNYLNVFYKEKSKSNFICTFYL